MSLLPIPVSHGLQKVDILEKKDIPLGIIDPDLADICYSGQEKMKYDVSWTGGIKIGEMYLEVNGIDDAGFEIKVRVTTENGAIHWVYPLEDHYRTRVKGDKKLPYHYEIWQDEGNDYKDHRILYFKQEHHLVRYVKNNRLKGDFQLDGEVHNEFSAFFNSRLMDFTIGEEFIVPTFADKKRVNVVVMPVKEKKIQETVLGVVSTVEIMPIMTFKGLYDKKGDTVIWYTNDECRVPVRINSKIVIGSLTAELTAYENPKCARYATGDDQRDVRE